MRSLYSVPVSVPSKKIQPDTFVIVNPEPHVNRPLYLVVVLTEPVEVHICPIMCIVNVHN